MVQDSFHQEYHPKMIDVPIPHNFNNNIGGTRFRLVLVERLTRNKPSVFRQRRRRYVVWQNHKIHSITILSVQSLTRKQQLRLWRGCLQNYGLQISWDFLLKSMGLGSQFQSNLRHITWKLSFTNFVVVDFHQTVFTIQELRSNWQFDHFQYIDTSKSNNLWHNLMKTQQLLIWRLQNPTISEPRDPSPILPSLPLAVARHDRSH